MLELLQAIRGFLVHLYRNFFADRIPQSAAALTYTTLFAVVPIMTVTFVMLAAVPAFRDLGEPIQAFIFRNFAPAAGEQVEIVDGRGADCWAHGRLDENDRLILVGRAELALIGVVCAERE